MAMTSTLCFKGTAKRIKLLGMQKPSNELPQELIEVRCTSNLSSLDLCVFGSRRNSSVSRMHS